MSTEDKKAFFERSEKLFSASQPQIENAQPIISRFASEEIASGYTYPSEYKGTKKLSRKK
jgi:hypothetical protein